jgi:GNAT superfamily N-acetyltransferase
MRCKMEIAAYQPLRYYPAVAALWERALGHVYPVTDRVLFQRIVSRTTLDAGDGMVALHDGQVVGFGIVEIDRAALVAAPSTTIQALIVDPAAQRQGVGRLLLDRLEQRCAAAGFRQITLSMGIYRFWSGLPDDLPAARAFFERSGYTAIYPAIDMYGPVGRFVMEPRCRARLAEHGVTAGPLADTDLGAVYDFLTRELPGWRGAALTLVTSGDMGNILIFKRDSEIVGSIQTYTPQSRFRGANLVWERIYGAEMGGFGGVLIGKNWRGKGLGTCLCQAAVEHLSARGATGCYIDWTNHERALIYRKIGAEICKNFTMFQKKLTA